MQMKQGVRRLVDAVITGMTAVYLLVVGSVTDAWRLRRTEEGGVADEAAMIAIVLGAAVLIGGIVYMLVDQAGEDLTDLWPGGNGDSGGGSET